MRPEIRLHVEPGMMKTWEDFCRDSAPCSIALDGYVDGAPAFEPSGPCANFDHHFGVNRLATRSTSGQVLVAVSLQLFDTFCLDDRPFANVYVNDCDQDVCLAYWLLSNAHVVGSFDMGMDIAQLIILEDYLDATAGAYPVHVEPPFMRKQAWVYELYDKARSTGLLWQMDAAEMAGIIEQTADRITRLSRGKAEEIDVIGEYELLGGGKRWKMIREQGSYARTKLFVDGVRAFVAVRELGDERYSYTIGRMSPFVNFPIARIYDQLNEAEPAETRMGKWGGSDTVGGSPRLSGSRLPPQEVERIVEDAMGDGSPCRTR